MSLSDAIRALVTAAPEDATVPVRWLAEQLAKHSDGAEAPTRTATSVDLTVKEVALRLERKPSTVRAWCDTGILPGAYRLRGREWRVPEAAIEAMQRAESRRHAHGVTALPVKKGNTETSQWRQHLPRVA